MLIKQIHLGVTSLSPKLDVVLMFLEGCDIVFFLNGKHDDNLLDFMVPFLAKPISPFRERWVLARNGSWVPNYETSRQMKSLCDLHTFPYAPCMEYLPTFNP